MKIASNLVRRKPSLSASMAATGLHPQWQVTQPFSICLCGRIHRSGLYGFSVQLGTLSHHTWHITGRFTLASLIFRLVKEATEEIVASENQEFEIPLVLPDLVFPGVRLPAL